MHKFQGKVPENLLAQKWNMHVCVVTTKRWGGERLLLFILFLLKLVLRDTLCNIVCIHYHYYYYSFSIWTSQNIILRGLLCSWCFFQTLIINLTHTSGSPSSHREAQEVRVAVKKRHCFWGEAMISSGLTVVRFSRLLLAHMTAVPLCCVVAANAEGNVGRVRRWQCGLEVLLTLLRPVQWNHREAPTTTSAAQHAASTSVHPESLQRGDSSSCLAPPTGSNGYCSR